MNRVMATKGSPTARVRALTRDFMFAVVENQPHIAIYIREEKDLSPEHREVINEMRREFDRKLYTLLEEGVAASEFSIDDVQLAALAVGGIVSWSSVWYRPDGRLTQAETADYFADLVLAMVQAKPVRRKRARSAV